MSNILNKQIIIIAGPCSVNKNSLNELFRIADIRVINSSNKRQRAIWGLRVVGLKSRTNMNDAGEGMGLDFREYLRNVDIVASGKTMNDFKMLPSIEIARRLVEKTGLTVATEIVNPIIQLPLYEKLIPENKLLIWNPAVNQLGYPMHIMGIYAKRNGWFIGIKNGKWFGENSGEKLNGMEKNWVGQISYAAQDKRTLLRDRIIMIHRGVDVAGKGKFRQAPVHDSTEKIKKITKLKMFFDPSHSLGHLLRDQIVEQTISAMQIKTSSGDYLYDGILIEAGTSKTDTEQHIIVKELQNLCEKISKFRDIVSPDNQQ